MNNKKAGNTKQKGNKVANNIAKGKNKEGEVKQDNRTEKRKTGDIGENIAAEFLMKQGFAIVERNYLKKYGEIDIITLKDGIYHFVEVKTVSCENFDDVLHETDNYKPEDNVHGWKLKKMGRVIETYVLDKKIFDYDWVVDVATVYLNTKIRKARVKMIEDIVV